MSGELVHDPVTEEEVELEIESTRKRIISDFGNALGKYNLDSTLSFISALSNFETTIRSASVLEGNADVPGTIGSTALKEGFKEAARATLGSAAPIANAVLAIVMNVKQEIDRAATAQQSHSTGDWIKSMRSGASDNYTNHGTSRVLLREYLDAYTALDNEQSRQMMVDDASYVTGAIEEGVWPVGSVRLFERALYEGWINAHFSHIGRDEDEISGFVDVRFDEEFSPDTVKVVAPLGDQIGDALNGVAGDSGLQSLMDLAVHKRVCRYASIAVGGEGWSCGWFDDRNELISEPNNEEVTDFLKREDWRTLVASFHS